MWIIFYTSFILNFIHKSGEKKTKYNICLGVLSPFFSHKRKLFITTFKFVHNNREFKKKSHFIEKYKTIYTYVNKELKFL